MKPSRSRVLEGENERGYHKFVDRLPDGIYRSTVQGRFLAVNSALVKMLGYVSKEQLLTINIPRDLYFSPEDRIKAKRKLKDNKTGTLIVRLKKKDGSELWVEEHGQQILDTRGRVIYYEGILRDITKRRQIENALRESEAKYRLLFEESKQAIFISQVDGRLDDINPTAIALFGYASKDEISQVNIASDLYVNPQDRVALIKSLEENGFVKDHQIVLKRKDGQRLNVLESATAVRNEDGKVIGYRWIIHDLTERKQLEEQLMHAQKWKRLVPWSEGYHTSSIIC